HTFLSRTPARAARLTTSLAPSTSDRLAADTSTARTSPVVSTNRCRFRPVTFFPPVVPAGLGRAGGLHRLAVQHPGRRLRPPALVPPDPAAEPVVDGLPHPGLLPQAEVVEHDPVGRQ